MVTGDTYMFPNIPKASIALNTLVALATGDPVGTAQQTLQLTGSGAVIGNDSIYTIDTFVTPVGLVSMWTSQGGVDYDAMGALLLRYYSDAAHPATDLSAYEKTPVAGVQAIQDAMVTARAKYFNTSLMDLSTTLTATTSMAGTAVVPGTGDSSTPAFSGMGGNIMWETHLGNTTAHVVFVEPFHPCMTDATGKCTN
jgi:hypothetical protein